MIDRNGLHFSAQTQSIYNSGAELDYTSGLIVDQWYHVAMVIDRTSNTLRAYVNGIEVTNSDSNNIDFNPNSIIKGYPGFNDENDPSRNKASTTIGKLGTMKFDNFKHNFNGAIDELKIFTVALSQEEIFNLFNIPSDHSVGALTCSTLGTSNSGQVLTPEIKILPNPSQEILTFHNSSEKDIEKIYIYSAVGKLVNRSFPKLKHTTIDISQLHPGIYFTVIHSAEQHISIKKLCCTNNS